MRDEEKSSVLPSMAAGLKTILFNVSTDGAELDHVPKTSSSSSSGAQTILNSIPLGGMIRDTILSSSLSSSVPNGRSTGFPDGFSTSAYGDEIKDYLEPVIVEESPKRLGKNLELKKNGYNVVDHIVLFCKHLILFFVRDYINSHGL